jgi:hypothetical protein
LGATKTEIGYWNWHHWYQGNHWKAYQTIESYDRKLGITPDDPVISIPDESICATLYLMNQKGWTEFGNNFSERDIIADKLKCNAKYLFINDTLYLNNSFIKPYTEHKIGQYENVAIYDLKSYVQKNN